VAQPKGPHSGYGIIVGWSIYAATVKAARTGAIEQVDVDTLEKVSGGHQLLPPVSSTELDYSTVAVFCSVALLLE